jgi:hypothetical protein
MARPSDQSMQVIKETFMAAMDSSCRASQTITCFLVNCKDVIEKVTIVETAVSEEHMKSKHICTKKYVIYVLVSEK